METSGDQIVLENMHKRRQVFDSLFGPWWEHLFPYLSNKEIGKLELILTEKSLRNLYLNIIKSFYLVNTINSPSELGWIMKREIELTICRLDFDGKTNMN